MNLIEDVEFSRETRIRPSAAGYSAVDEGTVVSQKLCVYNRTRECFLGLDVTAADLPFAEIKEVIEKLALRFGEGLWMSPFRGIPETGESIPLDLVYLNEQCRVIDVVESYPTFRVTPLSMHPASVLAVPTHTIYSSQTQPGDQLLVCAAEEMEQRLRQFTDSSSAPGSELTAALLREQPLWSGGPGLVQLSDRSPEERAIAGKAHEMGLLEPGARTARPPKNWLERWWSPDPRRAPRLPAPDLAAYYWNGGPPRVRPIKDISSTGLYVVTEERWYPGTLILMTLQQADAGESSAERAIAVHSRAVRWGNDGVGLQFILSDEGTPVKGNWPLVKGADRKNLDRFLKQLGKEK